MKKLRIGKLLPKRAWAASESDVSQEGAPLDKAVAAHLSRPWWKKHLNFVPTVPLTIVGIFLFLAVFANFVSPHDPRESNLSASLSPPFWVGESSFEIAGFSFTKEGGSMTYLLGTDLHGRDIFSRMIHGSRIAVLVSGMVLAIATTIGVSLGISSGYFGGKADAIIMRLVDIMLAFPPLLIAIVFSVVYEPSFRNVIIVISALYWAITARQVRAEALAIKAQDFVTLARVAGASHVRIMWKHILPNVIPTVLVITTLQVGTVILFEASLSFLGVGIPPPNPSWGVVVSEGRDQLSTAWWISLFPGMCIVVAVLTMNTLGDWVRDRLDPMMQHL